MGLSNEVYLTNPRKHGYHPLSFWRSEEDMLYDTADELIFSEKSWL